MGLGDFTSKLNKTQIISNMFAHYSSIAKNGHNTIGSDALSVFIFKKLDINNNNKLDSNEIKDLSTVLNNLTEEELREGGIAENTFGDSYTTQLEKAKSPQFSGEINNFARPGTTDSEKIVSQNLNEACYKLIEYARLHPEDERLQQYVAKLNELKGNLTVSSDNYSYEALTVTGERTIDFAANQAEILNPDRTMQALIHELGHYVNGDDLSSVAEELDVEEYSIGLTEKITGKPLYEDKEAHMKEFATRYQQRRGGNYGTLASPGYNGLPINSGFVIDLGDKVNSVITNGNSTTINVDGLFEGGITYNIEMGDEKDADGNPYPKSAERRFTHEGKEYIDQYTNYDKDRKVWLDMQRLSSEE